MQSHKFNEQFEHKKAILIEQTFQQSEVLSTSELEIMEPVDIDAYTLERNNLIQRTRKDHFASDLTLEKNEVNAEKKLMKLRDEIILEDPSIITGNFYDKYQKVKASKLYDAFDQMPKPAVHHLHLSAAPPLDYLIKLTYYDHVYFNDKAGLFKVTKNQFREDGYIPINDLRKYWGNALEFDSYLKRRIMLTKQQIQGKESHGIFD